MPAASPIGIYYARRQYIAAVGAYADRSGDLLAQAHCVASVLDNSPAAGYAARADSVVSLR